MLWGICQLVCGAYVCMCGRDAWEKKKSLKLVTYIERMLDLNCINKSHFREHTTSREDSEVAL